MRRLCVAVVVLMGAVLAADSPKLQSVWRLQDGSRLNFAGKKVAALVITDDQSLQMSGEEALSRELAARGVTGAPAYRFVPAPELRTAEKARVWFERAGVAGVVALRPVSKDQQTVYSPVVWASTSYNSYWGYYDYGWDSVAVMRKSGMRTTVVVEMLVFDLARDKLVWAATSETDDPENVQSFVKDLVKKAVDEMKKMKLVG